MKKLLSSLTIGLLLATALPVSAADSSVFTDVPADSVYSTPLTYLKQKGVITGYADGSFKPEQTVNRAEALKLLIGGYSKPLKDSGSSFPDVPQVAWYASYVSTALASSYVKGYPDGRFRPENTLNKAEALKIVHTIGDLTPSYTTIDPSIGQNEWYAPFLLSSFDKQLIDAGTPSSYVLTGNMTRGELATILYRVLYMREKNLSAFPLFDDGRVSYYSNDLVGNNTSSGEKYNPDLFTAAHKTLAFGSFIQVISPDLQKSVLVRVNDRGPYGESAVADLSSTAFEAMYPTSRGVFQGRVAPAGVAKSFVEKKYLSIDAFPGMTLDAKTPNMFKVGEMFLLRGTVATPNQPLEVKLRSPSGQVVEYEYTTEGTAVRMPLAFKEEGNYTLSVNGRGLQEQPATLYSTRGIEGRAVINIEPYSTNIEIGHNGEDVRVAWEKKNDVTMFRLLWNENGKKQEMYVNNQSQVGIAPELFGINPLNATLTLYGAKSSTSFSHDVYTNWVYLGETKLGTTASINNSTVAPGEEVDYMIKAMNADRARYSVAPLELHDVLGTIAQAKAEDMATNNYFAHENLAGEYVNDWKGKYGFAPLVTENIAYTSEDIASAYRLFQNSPKHFENIIDPAYTIAGIGLARSGNVLYVVQEFSTKPLGQSSVTDVKTSMLADLSDSNTTLTLNGGLDSVAQLWSNYVAESGQMSFYIGSSKVTEIVQKATGVSNVDLSVFSTDSIEKIKKNVEERVKSRTGTVEMGIGITQSDSGLIRTTLIIKAG